jgi:hypothetical protein
MARTQDKSLPAHVGRQVSTGARKHPTVAKVLRLQLGHDLGDIIHDVFWLFAASESPDLEDRIAVSGAKQRILAAWQ